MTVRDFMNGRNFHDDRQFKIFMLTTGDFMNGRNFHDGRSRF